MKRPAWLTKSFLIEKCKGLPMLKIGVGIFTVGGLVFFSMMTYRGLKPIFQGGFATAVIDAFKSTTSKISEIQTALVNNRELKFENAQLKHQLNSKEFDRALASAKDSTEKTVQILQEKAGNPYARLLETVEYEIPKSVTTPNLQTLALSYLKGEEPEKAAKIFNHLLFVETNHPYKTPTNFMAFGVALYQMEQYNEADKVFGDLINLKDEESILRVKAQARLWKALIADKTGKTTKAQFWMRDLIDHHPMSAEATWVNRSKGDRLPASLKAPATQESDDDEEEEDEATEKDATAAAAVKTEATHSETGGHHAPSHH